jgi:hypothetical protein
LVEAAKPYTDLAAGIAVGAILSLALSRALARLQA